MLVMPDPGRLSERVPKWPLAEAPPSSIVPLPELIPKNTAREFFLYVGQQPRGRQQLQRVLAGGDQAVAVLHVGQKKCDLEKQKEVEKII
jgi:hypothetical protein